MRLKYLAVDKDGEETLNKYSAEHVEKIISRINDTECAVVTFEVTGNTEKSAKILSEVYEHFRENTDITIVENESASYFNKRLYPLVNEFERKLRTFLYLVSGIRKSDSEVSVISTLEVKDFGEIFTILFVDKEFMNQIKSQIHKTQLEYFSKENIRKLIDGIKEDTIWDRLFEENVVPTLRKQFEDIRLYRNSVMHAHDFGWKRYSKIASLYNKVNKELDEEIDKIYANTSEIKVSEDFNDILNELMLEREKQMAIAEEYDELAKTVSFNMLAGCGVNPWLTDSIRMSTQEMLQARINTDKILGAKDTYAERVFKGNKHNNSTARQVLKGNHCNNSKGKSRK